MKRKTKPGPPAAATVELPVVFTERTLALFETALQEREQLQKWIGELSSRSNLSVKNQLCLALYRQQLLFREPPLPAGVPLNAMTVREYWTRAHEKYSEYESRTLTIESYLKPDAELKRDSLQRKVKVLDLISSDATTFQIMYPVVEDLFKRPVGRKVSRPAVAVRALQMKIDTGRTWMEIATEVCDCGKDVHDDCCRENIRQSVRALRVLLRKCGVEVLNT